MTPFKWTTIFTLIHFAMLVSVYFIDKSKANWLSGPNFLILGIAALLCHFAIMGASWKNFSKNAGLVLIAISGTLTGLFIYFFYLYLTRTS
ncbi:MAG: hypothetical protein ACT4OJ_10400 [Bacteroidota bacterium]